MFSDKLSAFRGQNGGMYDNFSMLLLIRIHAVFHKFPPTNLCSSANACTGLRQRRYRHPPTPVKASANACTGIRQRPYRHPSMPVQAFADARTGICQRPSCDAPKGHSTALGNVVSYRALTPAGVLRQPKCPLLPSFCPNRDITMKVMDRRHRYDSRIAPAGATAR